MIEHQVDVVIIGGGLVGTTLKLALAGLGYKTLLVDRHELRHSISPNFDARSLALSPASITILSMIGVWDLLQDHATPIQKIHVSDQHRFGASRLKADSNHPLGVVVEMQYINKALFQLLDHDDLLAPATVKAIDPPAHRLIVQTDSGEQLIIAQLIVAADGASSTVRSLCAMPVKIKDYQQQAIVANIGLTKDHDFQAFERFTKEGPLALLPMHNKQMSLVWAMSPERAKSLLAVADQEFLKALQQAFGYRLGRLVKVGSRFSYPLQQQVMPQQVKWPVVFVGNAAHTLHPVAGQGFNLGLRDVAALAQCINQYGLSEEMLQFYLKLRQEDQKNIIQFTNGLMTLFTSRIPGVGLARDLGLLALDNSSFLKQWLSRQAQGYSGIIPNLVCQIPLATRGLHEPKV